MQSSTFHVFSNPPSEQLICPLFSKAFFDPVISQSGHTFCRRCIDDGGDKVLCPIDGTGLVIVTRNLAVSEQVSQLELLCRYGLTEAEVSDPNSFHQIIKLRYRLSHEKNCGYEFVPSSNNPNCSHMRKMHLEEHLTHCLHQFNLLMLLRWSNGYYLGSSGRRKQALTHQSLLVSEHERVRKD